MDIHYVILETKCSLPTTLSKDNNSILEEFFTGVREWAELGDVIYNVPAKEVGVGYNVTKITNQTNMYYLLMSVSVSSESTEEDTVIKVLYLKYNIT